MKIWVYKFGDKWRMERNGVYMPCDTWEDAITLARLVIAYKRFRKAA